MLALAFCIASLVVPELRKRKWTGDPNHVYKLSILIQRISLQLLVNPSNLPIGLSEHRVYPECYWFITAVAFKSDVFLLFRSDVLRHRQKHSKTSWLRFLSNYIIIIQKFSRSIAISWFRDIMSTRIYKPWLFNWGGTISVAIYYLGEPPQLTNQPGFNNLINHVNPGVENYHFSTHFSSQGLINLGLTSKSHRKMPGGSIVPGAARSSPTNSTTSPRRKRLPTGTADAICSCGKPKWYQ